MKTKICNTCNTEKSETDFQKNGKYRKNRCNSCESLISRRKRVKKNPNIGKHKTSSIIISDDGETAKIDASTCKYPDAVLVVDSIDVHKVYGHVWSASERNGTIYARTSINKKTCTAHRLIYPEFEMIDHINRNGLDNRRVNLRKTNHQLNGRNRRATNGSGVCGVCFNRFKNKWQVTICVDYKNIRLGTYEKLEDAITARKNGEKEYWCDEKI